MKHKGKLNDAKLYLSLLIGGVAGASVTLLLAPQSGSKTKQMIKDFPREVREKAKKYIKDVEGKAISSVDKGKGFLGVRKSSLSRAVEAGREAYKKEILIRYLKRLANRS
ncbi:MAG: YtxH domain-containing protein [Nitrospirota bacterium]